MEVNVPKNIHHWYNRSMLRKRYRHLLWFFAKIILSFIWWDLILFRIGFRRITRATRGERYRKIAASFRAEAVELGGVLIKVGQFLSARLDILPPAITEELVGLQDEVKAESTEKILIVAQSEFKLPLSELFENIDPSPLAAASIGQVHRATLICNNQDAHSYNREVIIKIQRPDIDQIIHTDLSALFVVAGWIMKYPPIRKRANIPLLLDEIKRSIYEELDYLEEGKHAERFAENFAGDPQILVPGVVWSHTTKKVLTLEYVDAIKITDYQAIDAAGIDRKSVSKKLFDTYLKQIFDDRFFHADPHPGNLFVLPLTNEELIEDGFNWRLVFIDFGMAGEISEDLMVSLREILIAVGTQDARRIIKAYQSLGVLLPFADLDLLEKATNRVFERFWGKTVPELNKMHHTEALAFVKEFGDLLYDMPFQIPQNLLLLARSVGILSGMCTGLDSEFNVWEVIGPYAQKLVSADGKNGWQFWLTEIGSVVSLIAGLPRKTDTLLNRIEQGKLEIRLPETDRKIMSLDRSIRNLTSAIIFSGFIFASVQLFIANYNEFALVFAIGSLVTLVVLIFPKKR
jgi:predicted unusual protein kinase regulating ubiquinone biosynthesis (AarF/ABC1/UbiB family)